MELTAKQRIAKTAFQMFLEKGYQNTTIREIAQACGYSHVNILRHYKSKGELALHLIEAYIEQLIHETKTRASAAGLQPSLEYSNLYWLIHYEFLAGHLSFAKFYLDVHDNMCDEFHVLMERMSKNGQVTTLDLMGKPLAVAGLEADLYSRLVIDADMHLAEMLCAGTVSSIGAVHSMAKMLQLLLLHRTEDQAIDSVYSLRAKLADEICRALKSIENELLHKNDYRNPLE